MRGKEPWTASRVFVPSLSASASLLRQKITELSPAQTAELVATIPGSWGLLIVTGASPIAAAKQALRIEKQLIAENLAQAIATK